MLEEDYIKNRVEGQIKWYDDKSVFNQKLFKWLRTIEIICAATIPFIAGMGDTISFAISITGILGVIIAICVGISSLNKYQENWLTYRTTCETLRHEHYLFQTKSSPYDGDDSFNHFVERIENLLSKENTQWSRFSKKKEKRT